MRQEVSKRCWKISTNRLAWCRIATNTHFVKTQLWTAIKWGMLELMISLSAFFLCLPLSIVMTTCSTFFALGMMPLLLYLYSRGIYDGSLKDKVPYGGIVISLILILIPCTIGIILKSKRPQYVRYVTKVRTWGSRQRVRTPPSQQWMAWAKSFGLFVSVSLLKKKKKSLLLIQPTSWDFNAHEYFLTVSRKKRKPPHTTYNHFDNKIKLLSCTY